MVFLKRWISINKLSFGDIFSIVWHILAPVAFSSQNRSFSFTRLKEIIPFLAK